MTVNLLPHKYGLKTVLVWIMEQHNWLLLTICILGRSIVLNSMQWRLSYLLILLNNVVVGRCCICNKIYRFRILHNQFRLEISLNHLEELICFRVPVRLVGRDGKLFSLIVEYLSVFPFLYIRNISCFLWIAYGYHLTRNNCGAWFQSFNYSTECGIVQSLCQFDSSRGVDAAWIGVFL